MTSTVKPNSFALLDKTRDFPLILDHQNFHLLTTSKPSL
jgi:hypothetical protein